MDETNKRPDVSSLRIPKDKKNSDRPSSKKWRWVVWAVVLLLLGIVYVKFKEDITPATQVSVATATLLKGSEAEATLVATGYVVAQRKAEVASKGTGRLISLEFEEGDTVVTGQVIAELDNADIRANLKQARAELMAAEADSFEASRSYRRAVDLYHSGSITEAELELSEAAYKRSVAGVAAAQAAVQATEVALDNTFIKAPFNGTILSKNADIGEIVAPFASSVSSKGSVVTLADMNSLEVEADVSESNIHKVFVNQPCEIILDAYPNIRYKGYVKKIVPTADRTRATVLTKVAFLKKDSRVLPEMSARINFFVPDSSGTAGEEKPVLVIPNDAITNRDNAKVVFVVQGNYVTLRKIEPGRKLGNVTEILSGITKGEQVVLRPPGKLQSGQKIEISR